MSRITMFVACLILVGGPAAAQSKATIQKFDDKWAETFNKVTPGRWRRCTPRMPMRCRPAAEMMKGRSAIEAFWRQQMQQIGDVRCTALDVKPLGRDAAREIGTCSSRQKTNRLRTAL
jgi:hypothetical protein